MHHRLLMFVSTIGHDMLLCDCWKSSTSKTVAANVGCIANGYLTISKLAQASDRACAYVKTGHHQQSHINQV